MFDYYKLVSERKIEQYLHKFKDLVVGEFKYTIRVPNFTGQPVGACDFSFETAMNKLGYSIVEKTTSKDDWSVCRHYNVVKKLN